MTGTFTRQETVRRGNVYGMVGMGIAIAATLMNQQVSSLGWLILLMLPAGALGILIARRVQMTEMPELVAILHSFVGAAAVLVGVVSYQNTGSLSGSDRIIHEVEIIIGVIGGADMPVVVSMLNSYSGWAAAAAGFMLSNNLLIITGALVGSSGAILSYIMCRGMNRSFISVISGGFGVAEGTVVAASREAVKSRQSPMRKPGIY